MEAVRNLADIKTVVIFGKSTCCVSHSIKQLISSYGANPTVYELDEIPNVREIEKALLSMGLKPSVPAVFIGQKFVGGANNVISLQIQGKLVPMLMEASVCGFGIGHQQATISNKISTNCVWLNWHTNYK